MYERVLWDREKREKGGLHATRRRIGGEGGRRWTEKLVEGHKRKERISGSLFLIHCVWFIVIVFSFLTNDR